MCLSIVSCITSSLTARSQSPSHYYSHPGSVVSVHKLAVFSTILCGRGLGTRLTMGMRISKDPHFLRGAKSLVKWGSWDAYFTSGMEVGGPLQVYMYHVGNGRHYMYLSMRTDARTYGTYIDRQRDENFLYNTLLKQGTQMEDGVGGGVRENGYSTSLPVYRFIAIPIGMTQRAHANVNIIIDIIRLYRDWKRTRKNIHACCGLGSVNSPYIVCY